MPTVFVVGRDWRLRSLVRAELRERGVEALGMESLDDAARMLAAGTMPSVVVVDASCGVSSGAGLKPGATREAEESALRMLAKRAPLIVVASRTEAVQRLEWAAAVLYKPVSVGEVVARVERLLQGLAA